MSSANHPPQDLAAIPMAIIAAGATTRLHVGFRVLCVDYHNPVVLARELATIEDLAPGRLDIGLGAGWIAAEYDAMGIPLAAAGARIARVGDVVDLIRRFFANEPVELNGDTGVRASGFRAWSSNGGRPCPSIAVGGGGPNILRLAARKADVVAINFDNRAGALTSDGARLTNADRMAEKVSLVRDEAIRARRVSPPRLEAGVIAAAVTNDAVAAAQQYVSLFGMPAASILEHPLSMIGDHARICERVHELHEAYGITDFTIRDALLDDFAPVVDRLCGG
jgi:probable F420-dependent oxidoreductase